MSPAREFLVRRSLAVAALCAAPLAFAEERADPRPEMEAFARALDLSVRRVSRAGVGGFMVISEGCRGYHLKGYGAVFVLPPRALPTSGRNTLLFMPGPGFDVTGELRVEIQGEDLPGLAPPAPEPAGEAAGRREGPAPRTRRKEGTRHGVPDDDLRAIEEQVQALQREAERSRQEAERAMEAIVREMRRQQPTAVSAAEPPSPPSAPTPPAPPAPWRNWFETEDGEDAAAPERVLGDVRAAVTAVLEAQPPPRVLRPEEFVSVAVDFLPRVSWVGGGARPTKTLVVRVRKKEMEERQAGKLASEEFRKRIEYLEY